VSFGRDTDTVNCRNTQVWAPNHQTSRCCDIINRAVCNVRMCSLTLYPKHTCSWANPTNVLLLLLLLSCMRSCSPAVLQTCSPAAAAEPHVALLPLGGGLCWRCRLLCQSTCSLMHCYNPANILCPLSTWGQTFCPAVLRTISPPSDTHPPTCNWDIPTRALLLLLLQWGPCWPCRLLCQVGCEPTPAGHNKVRDTPARCAQSVCSICRRPRGGVSMHGTVRFVSCSLGVLEAVCLCTAQSALLCTGMSFAQEYVYHSAMIVTTCGNPPFQHQPACWRTCMHVMWNSA
jgi:hypothetical protein